MRVRSDFCVTRKQVLRGAAAVGAGTLLSTIVLAGASPVDAVGRNRTQHLAVRTASVATGALPVPRDEAVVQEQTSYTVFDSFNPFTPNGNEWPSGWLQICNEPFFYANVAAGKVVPWLATGFHLVSRRPIWHATVPTGMALPAGCLHRRQACADWADAVLGPIRPCCHGTPGRPS